jgi:hypothetical protein
MNKSKVVLLTILMISAVLIASIPISLNGRLAAGDYKIISKQEEFADVNLPTQRFHQLAIEGIQCVIIPDDTIELEVARVSIGKVEVKVSGDTLIMLNKSNTKVKAQLFASHVKKIVARNSVVIFKGTLYPGNSTSHEITLYNSTVKTIPISKETRILQFFDSIEIKGVGGAHMSLSGSVHINHLILHDLDSAFSDNMVVLRSFETNYSGKSRVSSLSTDGKFLIKAED